MLLSCLETVEDVAPGVSGPWQYHRRGTGSPEPMDWGRAIIAPRFLIHPSGGTRGRPFCTPSEDRPSLPSLRVLSSPSRPTSRLSAQAKKLLLFLGQISPSRHRPGHRGHRKHGMPRGIIAHFFNSNIPLYNLLHLPPPFHFPSLPTSLATHPDSHSLNNTHFFIYLIFF